MIQVNKEDLEYIMEPIVKECLLRYKGGESYFNELDNMIKNDEFLMLSFLFYAVQDSGINNVVLSGEIGLRYFRLKLKLQNRIPDDINLYIINGGLRNGKDITGGITSNLEVIPKDLANNSFIFLDDSFYSGKTANKVEEFITSRGGRMKWKYVLYDGSKEKREDVKSIYRYYD